VSVATAVFLHRYKVRKDRFDSYFDRLIVLKQQIDDVPNFDMTPMLACGHTNGEDTHVVMPGAGRQFHRSSSPKPLIEWNSF
jgi:hypothetical protein